MQMPDHLMPPSRRPRRHLSRWNRQRFALRIIAAVMLLLLGAGLVWALSGGLDTRTVPEAVLGGR